jgi:hypothetical protein
MIPTNGTLKKIKYLLSILALAIILAGCRPNVETAQAVQSEFLPLSTGQVMGQSFVSHFDGLGAVGVLIKPETADRGVLKFVLYPRSDQATPLRQVELPVSAITYPGYTYFYFPPISGSSQKDYYFSLEWNGNQSISVGVANGSTYQDGALYDNQEAQDKQLTFELIYGRRLMLAGLVQEMFSWLGILLVAVFLFCIPGWALLSYFHPTWDSLDFWAKIALGAGTSIALYPIFILWTDLIGLHLGALYAWLPALAGSAAILVRSRKNFTPASLKSIRFHLPAWSSVAMFLTVSLVILVRFWVVRSLSVPMWGDSYQHTMITQLIMDNHGLFSSWAPYVPYNSLTVHFGFSVAAALISWIAGMLSTQGTLVTGQIINCLAVITLYPITLKLSNGNRWAGVAAVTVAGLVSPLPAYYVNWGRYAQLAGQAILPVAMWLTWESVDVLYVGPKENGSPLKVQSEWSLATRRAVFITALVISGMTLSYYRTTIFFTSFILAWLIGWVLPGIKFHIKPWLVVFSRLVVLALLALILLLPWLRNVMDSSLSSLVGVGVTSAKPLAAVSSDYQAWLVYNNFFPSLLAWISVFAAVWGLFLKKWMVASILLWIAIVAVYPAGALIQIPGANLLQSFAVIIALYIPAAILIGWAIGEISQRLPRNSHKSMQIGIGTAIGIIALLGAWKSRAIVNPESFALVTRPDLRAMEWIQENIPKDSRLLVEGFPIYGGTSAVGSDSGWWISLLGMRQNTMPPQYALLNEQPVPPDYSKRIVLLVNELSQVSPGSKEGLDYICSEGVTHAFIGQRQGQVGGGVSQLFDSSDFEQSPYWESVYHQDRVYIYELKPGACR